MASLWLRVFLHLAPPNLAALAPDPPFPAYKSLNFSYPPFSPEPPPITAFIPGELGEIEPQYQGYPDC